MGIMSATRSASCRRVMEERWTGRREYWQDLMNRHESSGKSIAAFCKDEGVHTTSFYSWRRKLSEPRKPDSDFIEVVLPDVGRKGSEIGIELGNGVCLRVVPGFDRECLKGVISVVQEAYV